MLGGRIRAESGLLIVVQRFLYVFLILEDGSQIEVRRSVVRLDLKRCLEGLGRFFKLPQAGECDTQHDMRLGVLGM